MTKLYEDQQKPLSDKDKDFLKKKGLVWKGYAGGYGKEGKGSPVIYKNVDGQLQKVGDDEGQSEEAPQQEPEQQTQKITNIKKNPHDKNDDEVKQIIDIALGLEGLRRQDGIHAAAIVISPDTITKFLPIQQKGSNAEIVTQYEMHTVEQLGLLKMDFLGLRNLSIVDSLAGPVEPPDKKP